MRTVTLLRRKIKRPLQLVRSWDRAKTRKAPAAVIAPWIRPGHYPFEAIYWDALLAEPWKLNDCADCDLFDADTDGCCSVGKCEPTKIYFGGWDFDDFLGGGYKTTGDHSYSAVMLCYKRTLVVVRSQHMVPNLRSGGQMYALPSYLLTHKFRKQLMNRVCQSITDNFKRG